MRVALAERYEVRAAGYVTPCWMWRFTLTPKGYARMRVPGEERKVMAHRFYYELHAGPIPAGLQLDHLCRNRGCVNPAHLEPVTGTENTRRGANAKLTAAQVEDLRRDAATSTTAELAERYGISPVTVRQVRSGRTWKNNRRALDRVREALDRKAA